MLNGLRLMLDVGTEKRINKILIKYWNDLKEKSGGCPHESDIDPDKLKNVWDNCFLIDMKNTSRRRYRYSYLGPSIIDAYGGEDVTGKDVYQSLVSTKDSNIVPFLEQAVESREPVSHESEFVNKNNVVIKYRRCFLPLLNIDGNIGFILGGMRWIAV